MRTLLIIISLAMAACGSLGSDDDLDLLELRISSTADAYEVYWEYGKQGRSFFVMYKKLGEGFVKSVDGGFERVFKLDDLPTILFDPVDGADDENRVSLKVKGQILFLGYLDDVAAEAMRAELAAVASEQSTQPSLASCLMKQFNDWLRLIAGIGLARLKHQLWGIA